MFRNQTLKSKKFIRSAKNFGSILNHPFKANPEKGNPEAMRVFWTRERPSKIKNWHSDATYRINPPDATMLRSLVLPSCGGDTLFANMEKAYELLDDETKEKIEDLQAVHDMHFFKKTLRKSEVSEEKIALRSAQFLPSKHPIVRTHPVSGRKCIFVNKAFTVGIEGMSEAESKPLLEKLYLTAWQPEVQCRFSWQLGSVAIWDNCSSQHYPVSDYWPETRGMERITIKFDW